jgi:hypothetical protein
MARVSCDDLEGGDRGTDRTGNVGSATAGSQLLVEQRR